MPLSHLVPMVDLPHEIVMGLMLLFGALNTVTAVPS